MPGADIEHVCTICHPPKGQLLTSDMLLPEDWSRHFAKKHPKLPEKKWEENTIEVHW